MCIFNARVQEVGGTKILVGRTKDGERQLVVYQNHVTVEWEKGGRRREGKLEAAKQRLLEREEATPAMVLPFPNAEGGEVQLLDLSGEGDTLFRRLRQCFPSLVTPKPRKKSRQSYGNKKLEVQQVGSYNVSVASSLADLRRIDPSVDQLLGAHYGEGFGFIIAAFDPAKRGEKHPLGYVHELPEGEPLFVPTRHHHGGEEEEEEELPHWDHEIYSVGGGASGGLTAEEMTRALESSKSSRQTVEPPSLEPGRVLNIPGVQLEAGQLRLLERKGALANEDTFIACSLPRT